MYRLILLNCLFFTLTAACMAAVKERPPNVIVIFCDDLGYGELPVYRELYKDADKVETAIGSFTPNLDRLAKDGVITPNRRGQGALWGLAKPEESSDGLDSSGDASN
jgi:hypothetical protein